jgi:hypothetical protein
MNGEGSIQKKSVSVRSSDIKQCCTHAKKEIYLHSKKRNMRRVYKKAAEIAMI